jgi:hypothetical protein
MLGYRDEKTLDEWCRDHTSCSLGEMTLASVATIYREAFGRPEKVE